jgi:hypothetical protein
MKKRTPNDASFFAVTTLPYSSHPIYRLEPKYNIKTLIIIKKKNIKKKI